ncbi:flavin prenyltransferase UbiX [Alteromonas sp. CYL-A6]|uniref:flavin prenyltransferase UbiX n=1 Tax=Alteromonas nitratireducens TaxID=3390813 RepID=UPI0034C0AFD6
MKQDKRITLAITGASGAPYAMTLLKALVKADYQVYVLMSSAARVVFATEENLKVPSRPDEASAFFSAHCQAKPDQIRVFGKEEWFSPVASGSAAPRQMVICPCSTGTLSAVAVGASDNLIERAADVVIKERGQLILVPREMPLSTIHLENMLSLSRMGVTIMPAAPGYYHNPVSIQDLVDFVVARILDHLGVDQSLVARWGYDTSKHSEENE